VLLSKVYLKVRPLEFLENETKITFVSPFSYACSFFPFLFLVWGSRHPFCDRSSSRTSASRLGKVYLGQSTGWLGKEIVTVASGSNMNSGTLIICVSAPRAALEEGSEALLSVVFPEWLGR
jgi:hypothetical protein